VQEHPDPILFVQIVFNIMIARSQAAELETPVRCDRLGAVRAVAVLDANGNITIVSTKPLKSGDKDVRKDRNKSEDRDMREKRGRDKQEMKDERDHDKREMKDDKDEMKQSSQISDDRGDNGNRGGKGKGKH